ncbi:MAG: DinB family protein [Frankiaceae bacterium]|nr:DinB family protein [Frankiaceae bacterium]MBV9872041.1 DinB family protein [Frankiaceae bacterium]
MAETQRQPVPRNDDGEIDTALAFLAFARECVIKKTDGLSEDDLRRVMVDTGTSLLGLVQHLTDAERYWFGYHVGGIGQDDFDFSMAVPADRPAAAVLQDYRDAIAASDDLLRSITDFDQLMAIPTADRRHSVRWVVAHVTGETTRHAGHADILRELIDGTTGR